MNPATGSVRVLLRLEGAAALALCLVLYAGTGHGWGLFALGFLVPDLALLGYLRGPRTGGRLYNATHSYLAPMLLLALGFPGGHDGATVAGLVWASHIGFDRMLGYGLKYPRGFRHTHLGRIGRSRAARRPSVGYGDPGR